MERIITLDTPLYMLGVNLWKHELVETFLGRESPEDFVAYLKSSGTFLNYHAEHGDSFITTATDLLNDQYIWLSEADCEADIEERRDGGETIAGTSCEFTLKDAMKHIVEQGESALELEEKNEQ